MATVVTLTGAYVAFGGSAQASMPLKAQTPLQRGLAYYNGKSITYIAPSTAGSSYDLIGRDITPFLSQYLHATISVEDISAGGTIGGQDDLAGSPANGLTIGGGNLLGDAILALTNGALNINFQLNREVFLGGFSQGSIPVIGLAGSADDTLQGFMTDPHPSIGTGCSGGTVIIQDALKIIWNPNLRIVCGYSSVSAATTGFVRGDTTLTNSSMASMGPLVAGGKGVPLMDTAKPAKGLAYADYFAGTPTFAQVAKKYPPKTKRGKAVLKILETVGVSGFEMLMAPSAVPNPQRQALLVAVQWAIKQPTFQSEMISQGTSPKWYSPRDLKSLYAAVFRHKGLISSVINGTS